MTLNMKIKQIHNRQTRIALLLFLIIAAGFMLRIYAIDHRSMWVDEESSIHFAEKSANNILAYADKETHPPLYYLILHHWINLFGESEAAVRSLSLIFGVVSIFLIYKTGKLMFSKEAGIISALILTLSAFHIYVSQEARMYSMMAMLALMSMYLFIMMQKKKSIYLDISYILSSTLLIYSHIYGIFIIAAQNIYLFMNAKEKNKIEIAEWLITQTVLFVLFLPWIYVLIEQIAAMQSGNFININWLSRPGIYEIFETFSLYFYYNIVALIFFIILASRPYIKLWGKEKNRQKKEMRSSKYLAIIWLLTIIILPFLISWTIFPIYLAKYTIAASFALYIMAAEGISSIRKKGMKATIITMLILLSLISAIYYYVAPEPEQWRELGQHIDENAQKGDLVITVPFYTKESVQRYSDREDIEITGERDILGSDPDRIWVTERYEEFNRTTDSYAISEKSTFGDLKLYLFEKIK